MESRKASSGNVFFCVDQVLAHAKNAASCGSMWRRTAERKKSAKKKMARMWCAICAERYDNNALGGAISPFDMEIARENGTQRQVPSVRLL